MSGSSRVQRILADLKRRKVFHVVAAYGAAAFVVIEAADQLEAMNAGILLESADRLEEARPFYEKALRFLDGGEGVFGEMAAEAKQALAGLPGN